MKLRLSYDFFIKLLNKKSMRLPFGLSHNLSLVLLIFIYINEKVYLIYSR